MDHLCPCCGPHPESSVFLDGIDVSDDCIYADPHNGFVILFAREEGSDPDRVSRVAVLRHGDKEGYLVKVVKHGDVKIEEGE